MQKKVSNILSVAQLYTSNKMIENIYIHLPFCQKKCHFCAFPIHALGKEPQRQMLSKYISYLKQQITIAKQHTRISPTLKSLYFGGGTPSLHTPQQIRQIMDMFPLDEHTEVTIEVNPTQIERIKQFTEIGVSRVSLGIQSFNNTTVASMGRFHDNKSRQNIQQMLNKNRPKNLSTDFILNFCTQQQDFKEMLDFIKCVFPQHLTIYMLEINQGSKIYEKKQLLSNLPSEQKTLKAYIELVQLLKTNGYDHYEISNFVKYGKAKSIHNAAYWQGDKQFLAFGMGASSLVSSQRVTKPRSLTAYYRFVQSIRNGSATQIECSQQKSPQQRLQAILMSGLRTTQGVPWQKINQIITEKSCQRMKDIVNEIEKQRPGIIRNTEDGFSLNSPNGLLLADEICFRLSSNYG